MVRPVRVSAVLLPVGKGVEQWEEFGQCLCMDWFPGNKRCKVAAGFSNGAHPNKYFHVKSWFCLFAFLSGSVCVWDLKAKLFQSSSFPASTLATFHPMVHVAAHKYPCRCVSWCPHEDNYLFTGEPNLPWVRGAVSMLIHRVFSGGVDKMANLWDIRQPFTPVDRQQKGEREGGREGREGGCCADCVVCVALTLATLIVVCVALTGTD